MPTTRDVAQPGSAPALGAGGRRFESGRPDVSSGPAPACAGGREHRNDRCRARLQLSTDMTRLGASGRMLPRHRMTTARGPGVPAIARDVRAGTSSTMPWSSSASSVRRSFASGRARHVPSSASWPAEHARHRPTLEARDRVARRLPASRRGVAAWRPGSRTFAELALLGGVAVAGRAALIAAIRISTPAARDPEVVVVISSGRRP